ncbi:hypothetical protein [Actinoplanes sp. GCM10030250]|uniref:hypothetical protein n=1 Tax=Actinoplanes sp. GCM10030250 TaxID=3273376 RepID=UPI003614984B
MSDPLARRYARWLRFYPPGARRAEMLGTLLECSPPGRTRPTLKEKINLSAYGLRARLGRPASTSIVVLATFVALAAGLFGAAGAARAGWEMAPALPSGAESEALGSTVFPGLHVWGGGDAETFVPSGDLESTVYGFADYWVKNTPETRNVRSYATAARDRLAAAGWDIRTEIELDVDLAGDPPTSSAHFVATRDGLVLSYDGVYWQNRAWYDADGGTGFELSRSATGWMTGLTVAGGLLAALTGWLLTGWASRRTEDHPFRAIPAAALAWTSVVVSLLLALLGGLWSWQPDRPGDEPIWHALRILSGESGLWVLALGLGGLAIAAWPTGLRALIPAALALIVAGAAAGWPATSAIATCTPSGPPANPPPAEVAHSRIARVFVAQNATDEQRNLAEAAIGRVWGTRSYSFHYDPTDPEYRYAYCEGARLSGQSGMTMPYFWEIDMSSPGVFPALAAEVGHAPGIVAVRHALPYR